MSVSGIECVCVRLYVRDIELAMEMAVAMLPKVDQKLKNCKGGS